MDRLQYEYKKTVNPKEKANCLFLMSEFYRDRDSLTSKNYLSSAQKLVGNDVMLSAKSSFYEGMLYYSNYKDKAAPFLKESIEKFEKIKTKEADYYQAAAWYYYAATQKDNEGYGFVIKQILEHSLPLVEKHHNQKKIANYYNLLGIIFTYNLKFKKSEEYLFKAQKILEKTAPSSVELYNNYLNLCNNFCYQSNGNTAKVYLKKAEAFIKNYPNSSYNTAYIFSNTLYHITTQQNLKALDIIENGMLYSTKFGQRLYNQFFAVNKFDILTKLGHYNEAKTTLLNVLEAKFVTKDAYNRKTIYQQLVRINELMKNDKEALKWSKLYSKLSDSINDSKMKLEVSRLETQYQTSEKQKEINQKIFEISKKNQYMWILGLLALLLLTLAIFLILYNKNRRKLAVQREINLHQKLTQQEQGEKLKITQAMLNGEEQERERIAKDLHDGLGGLLAGAKLNLSSWGAQHTNTENEENFQKIVGQLDYSVNELRRLSRNMMPVTLLNFGLEIALKDLCDYYNTTKTSIEFQPMNIEKNLSSHIQINIYRIVQELLSNAIKHSKANNILVQCSQSDDFFFITVEDNGIGFNQDHLNSTEGLGMHNLKTRIELLKGKMEIISAQNEGTSINIELRTDAKS